MFYWRKISYFHFTLFFCWFAFNFLVSGVWLGVAATAKVFEKSSSFRVKHYTTEKFINSFGNSRRQMNILVYY